MNPDQSSTRPHLEVDLAAVDAPTMTRLFREFGFNGANVEELRERIAAEGGNGNARVVVMKALQNEPFHETTRAGIELSRATPVPVVYKSVPTRLPGIDASSDLDERVASDLRGAQLLGIARPNLDEAAVFDASLAARRAAALRREQAASNLLAELDTLKLADLPLAVDWLARLEALTPPNADQGRILAAYAAAGFHPQTHPWTDLAALPPDEAAREIIEQALQDISDCGLPIDIDLRRGKVPSLKPPGGSPA